ncbi:MAG: DegV family protein [Caldilineae bacterium]|nr:MAG: DegV family protein [Caldilineae bacterium]
MIRVVTDTTAGLPPDLAARHQIPVVPQVIIFDGEEFLELEELSHEEFMTRLVASKNLPKTAAPAPSAFEAVYRPFVEAGDTIISIHPSTEISGTVRGATVAAQSFPGADIRILDTRTIAGPLARMVLTAAQWAEAGKSADEIMAGLHQMIKRQRIYFLVETLEYLQKGGRIGGAQALVGTLLQMKPILTLRDGRVEPVERQRTFKKALARLKELVIAEAAPGADAQLTIMHAASPDIAQALADDLKTALDAPEVMMMNLVPAIVTHAGPGALAVGFFARE